jgi:hypothetical protein
MSDGPLQSTGYEELCRRRGTCGTLIIALPCASDCRWPSALGDGVHRRIESVIGNLRWVDRRDEGSVTSGECCVLSRSEGEREMLLDAVASGRRNRCSIAVEVGLRHLDGGICWRCKAGGNSVNVMTIITSFRHASCHNHKYSSVSSSCVSREITGRER